MTRLLAAFATLALAAPSALAAESKTVDLDASRMRAQDASAIVQADERFVALAQRRVEAYKYAWDDAVKNGHPKEAGKYAVEHWKALQVEIRGRIALDHARRDFAVARENLIADEFTLQQG